MKTISKTLLPLLCIGCVLPAFSQGTVSISNGAHITTTNDAYLVLENMNLDNDGSFVQSVGDGTLKLTGTLPILLSGTGTTTLDQLEVDMAAPGTTATLSAPVRVLNVLSPTTGQLASNANLTLASVAGKTARVAQMNTATASVVGDVTVERHIPGAGNRAWRLLGAALSPTGAPTIFDSWQESGAVPTGYGTWITDPNSGAGYDGTSFSSSLRYYDGNLLQTPPNTNSTLITDYGGAYFLFVRGDRNNTGGGVSGNTTLRMTGVINQGNVTVGVAATGGGNISLIPNPYPSPVDFEEIQANPANGSVSTFYIWDSQIGSFGAYRTVQRTGAGTYQATPPTANDNLMRYISSGQAFFVQGNAQFNFTESMKTVSEPPIVVFKNPANEAELLMLLNIVNGPETTLADGIRVKFDLAYNPAVTAEDLPKLENINENIAIMNNADLLAVEKRLPATANDTIHLRFWHTSLSDYQFRFQPSNMSGTQNAYLVDNYLNSLTPIDLANESTYNFTVNSDTGAWDPNRFSIVFNKGLDVNSFDDPSGGIAVYPNPVKDNELHFVLNGMASGKYAIKLYDLLGRIVKNRTIEHSGDNSAYKLEVSNLASGVYLLEIGHKENGTAKSVKIIVQ